MQIPGSNLLNMAFSVIAKQQLDWYVFSGTTTNEIGMVEKQYNSPVSIVGSFQPVDKEKYADLGLDFKKIYFDLFTSNNILGVARDYSGDYAIFNGQRFYVADETEWFQMDGWNHAVLVKAPLNNA